jgi:DNA modification methylase
MLVSNKSDSAGSAESHCDLQSYLRSLSTLPFFLCGDALQALSQLPDESIDMCMTSPPYWGQRQYTGGGIGLEEQSAHYIDNLIAIFDEVHRVVKTTGSFWLNIGDAYSEKRLLGIPWRVAIRLTDEKGWILRNNIAWNKVKGGLDNTRDRLRNVHEDIFHFVKSSKGYFYDVDAIRTTPKKSKVVNGSVVSATGVSGVRYRRQIELSSALDSQEKQAAITELNKILTDVRTGKLADFRMIIRGQQRTTHSDSEKVSGRAREVQQRGFYFLKYHPDGSKPSDVWDILPEDTQRRGDHFAPYPEDLCKIPILATCPESGIVLDPFCGTGTTMFVAHQLGRRSIGIDISNEYIQIAIQRCSFLL